MLVATSELSFFSLYLSDDGDDLVPGQHVSEVETVVFGGPLISSCPISRLQIDIEQLENEATP